jgi:hypothetical protein
MMWDFLLFSSSVVSTILTNKWICSSTGITAFDLKFLPIFFQNLNLVK